MLAWCIEMGASILRNPFWSWQLERHFSKPKQIMFMDASLGNFQIPKLVQHDIQLGTYSTHNTSVCTRIYLLTDSDYFNNQFTKL